MIIKSIPEYDLINYDAGLAKDYSYGFYKYVKGYNNYSKQYESIKIKMYIFIKKNKIYKLAETMEITPVYIGDCDVLYFMPIDGSKSLGHVNRIYVKFSYKDRGDNFKIVPCYRLRDGTPIFRVETFKDQI